jgi:hypothetical protein
MLGQRYQRAVDMLAGLNRDPGKEAVAWDSALIYDMIMTQPVLYRFGVAGILFCRERHRAS